MKIFIRIGTLLLNLDHIIEIDLAHQREWTYWGKREIRETVNGVRIVTTENWSEFGHAYRDAGSGGQRVMEFFGQDAERLNWFFTNRMIELDEQLQKYRPDAFVDVWTALEEFEQPSYHDQWFEQKKAEYPVERFCDNCQGPLTDNPVKNTIGEELFCSDTCKSKWVPF
jgi:hypothetical protein